MEVNYSVTEPYFVALIATQRSPLCRLLPWRQFYQVSGDYPGALQRQMDGEANEQLPKQERLRTRWTASLDKIFADLVVQQIQLGNRPNNVFDKKTWNHIREEFNRQTNLNFNNNQLRKHLDVLRTRYCSLKSAFDQQDPIEDSCYIGFDLWEDIGAQHKPAESTKIKDCPIYDQLCAIFADSGADGKYAQSSHYEELDKSAGKYAQSSHYEELDKSAGTDPLYQESGNALPQTPALSRPEQGNPSPPQNMNKTTAERKRKRPAETSRGSGESYLDGNLRNIMAGALLDMIGASKLRSTDMSKTDDKFTITNCIKALDEIEGIEDWLYYAALDLFEDPSSREMFLSLKSNTVRLTWLQGKCGHFFS
ncbi:L10-interacting MYB domain-containing protein-like [Coffea eugenioides]|uniref:L10-interacting MYB domain-containing protein-like n=1 Tax=Coffea eugenioides TaxID=49369 RepID=UPI000F6075B4|nr:L10-interacting MYB domain-containing protein-like [Coffea eugenioides]XP_027148659.1 L10-interacting MYB domain-containing protein-like [Coffea eugenioides]